MAQKSIFLGYTFRMDVKSVSRRSSVLCARPLSLRAQPYSPTFLLVRAMFSDALLLASAAARNEGASGSLWAPVPLFLLEERWVIVA